MLTLIAAAALAAANPAAPATTPADPHAGHGGHATAAQAGHSAAGHAMSEECKEACKEMAADGKMECTMHTKDGDAAKSPAHQGHAGH